MRDNFGYNPKFLYDRSDTERNYFFSFGPTVLHVADVVVYLNMINIDIPGRIYALARNTRFIAG